MTGTTTVQMPPTNVTARLEVILPFDFIVALNVLALNCNVQLLMCVEIDAASRQQRVAIDCNCGAEEWDRCIGVRRSGLGWSEMTGFCYFLTSVGGNCFRNVGKCNHTSSIGNGWSSGSQTSLTSCYFLFRSRFYFRFYLSFRRDTYSSALPCTRATY